MARSNEGGQGGGEGGGYAGGGTPTTQAQTKWGLIIAIGLGVLVIAGGAVIFFVKG
jgi:hypothetical protein